MKPTTLLLTASLVANTALIAFVATRPAASTGTSHAPHPAASPTSPSAAKSSAPAQPSDAPAKQGPEARDLSVGRALARYQQRLAAARSTSAGDGRWWRSTNATRNREEELAARRELVAALQTALGDDLGLTGADSSALAFLSPEKRAALLRVMQDYDEMMAKFGAAGGIQLASDKEKLRLLRAERDRDIAALLSPSELADYELRTSPSAATVRNRYGDGIQNEDDFRKLFALQKAFDEKFPAELVTGRVAPETLRARSDAQQQLQADIRATLGEDKYAALRRATDPELRALDGLVSRLNLPANTTERVATARETFATESQRINADASLSPADRRTALTALGNRAKSELASTLGAEVAEAYTPRANWVGLLQNGLAYSTTPTANTPGALSLSGSPTQSVFPIMPTGGPGAGGAPAVRQVVNMVSTTENAGPAGGGTFILGGGAPVERSMQLISVTNNGTTTTGSNPHGDTTTTTPAAPKP